MYFNQWSIKCFCVPGLGQADARVQLGIAVICQCAFPIGYIIRYMDGSCKPHGSQIKSLYSFFFEMSISQLLSPLLHKIHNNTNDSKYCHNTTYFALWQVSKIAYTSTRNMNAWMFPTSNALHTALNPMNSAPQT